MTPIARSSQRDHFDLRDFMATINRVTQSQKSLLMDGEALFEISYLQDMEGHSAAQPSRARGGGGKQISNRALPSIAAWLSAKNFCYDPASLSTKDLEEEELENSCFFGCVALEIL